MNKFIKKISLLVILSMFINVLNTPIRFIDNTVKAYADTISSKSDIPLNNSIQQQNISVDEGTTNTLINVRCSAKTSNSLTLEWDKVTNGSNTITYEIYMGSKKIGTTSGETKFVAKYLAPNQKYKFYIIAKDNTGKAVSKSDSFQETTSVETKPSDDPNNHGGYIKPETLIYVENQDFSKDVGGILEVKGCFLSNDASSIDSKVFIDGVDVTSQADDFLVGTERTDLASKYPNYINAANSGFSFDFDTYNISNGQHTLKLMFHETSKEFKFNVNNIERKIVLDNSDYSQSQQGMLTGSGYVLSSYDPNEFLVGGLFSENSDVYVDGKPQSKFMDNKLNVLLNRDDVKQKYPNYNYAEKCGFSFKLDTLKMSNGEHIIKLKFLSIETEFKINVQNEKSDIVLDGVNNNQTEQGFFNGTGYIISGYDPNEFDPGWGGNTHLYVDGEVQDDILNEMPKVKLSRDDVNQKYPNYKYSDRCGFSFKIDTYKLSNGKHTIKLKFLSVEKEFIIDVENIKPDIVVEGIDTNKAQEGIINGTGYIISGYDPSEFSTESMKNCNFYVDDQSNSFTTQILIPRDDIKQKYPSYKYADKCGFAFTIDTNSLSNGKHVIKFEFANVKAEFTINVQNKYKDIVIEGLNTNQSQEGIIKGTGYILSSYDPTTFENSNCSLLIDSVEEYSFLEENPLQLQISRTDIKQKYPDYMYGDRCGFTFVIDTTKFTNGKHKLKIKIRNIEKEIEININNKTSNIVVESTSKSDEGAGKMVISGYVLSPYSPEDLKNDSKNIFSNNNALYIDGDLVSDWGLMGDPDYEITLGIIRDDIKAKYPEYKYSGVSGFTIKINNSKLAQLTNGSHKLKISFRAITKEFTFNKGSNTGDQLFDAAFYADKYPDLKDAFGYDETKLYNHFITCGIKEGRCSSAIFDVKYYLENNSDLIAAFGATNYQAAYNHFKSNGYKENRNLSPIFNMAYYCKNNPDVVKAFGTDYYSIMNHFLNYGMSEGRNGSENFNLKIYKNKYQSLVYKYGDNNKLYYFDYLISGMSEGKTAK